MKNKIGIFLIFILVIPGILRSQIFPTYTLTARNFHLNAPDSLKFDIYLLHTNYPTPFIYSIGQYYLNFNPNFGNGGSLTFNILESEMDTSCRPRDLFVTNGTLRFATNTPPGTGIGCEISHTGLGTLVGRFSLVTTTNFLPLDSFRLRWKNIASGNPYTKIAAFVGSTIFEITDSSGHHVDFLSLILEPVNSLNPTAFKLYQNYPNPFNPKTIISYELRITSYVMLKLFDMNGEEIDVLVNGKKEAGSHTIEWDASNYSSGIYFYKLISGEFEDTKRMTFIK